MTEPVGDVHVAGRPRDSAIDDAVLDAVRTMLREAAYSRLTIEGVARRAGTTKPAIYRRWRGRRDMVLAALARDLEPLQDAPDTGCTLCDLFECMRLFVDVFEAMPNGLLGSLLADCLNDDEAKDAFMAALFHPPRQAVARTLRHARERGDLREDVDLELALDALASLVHFRAVFGHAATDEGEIVRAIEALLRGLAKDYDSLVEHSRRLRTAHSERHE